MNNDHDMTDPAFNLTQTDENQPDKLDAFGHLNWTVNSLEDQTDGGEWMACFDAIYNPSTGLVDYHVVIDTEFFTDTPERGSVAPAEIDDLKDLPERYHYIGIEQGVLMNYKALKATSESWNAHIDQLKESIPKDPLNETTLEQSLEYFDRYIAGDR